MSAASAVAARSFDAGASRGADDPHARIADAHALHADLVRSADSLAACRGVAVSVHAGRALGTRDPEALRVYAVHAVRAHRARVTPSAPTLRGHAHVSDADRVPGTRLSAPAVSASPGVLDREQEHLSPAPCHTHHEDRDKALG